MKLRGVCLVVGLLVAGVGAKAAYPWPGLWHCYLADDGCVFQLLELSLPHEGRLGRVAFTHNGVSASAGTIYFLDFDQREQGNYGFRETGIQWATGEVYGGWSVFWAPWGNWW